VNGFIDHLYTRLETTSNYSATASLHNSQITTAPAKRFPVCCVFTSRSMATACNSGDSSASRAQVFSSQPPVQNWSKLKPRPLLITSQHGPHTKHSSISAPSLRSCLIADKTVPSPCPETALVYPPISLSLHSNGSTRYITSMYEFRLSHRRLWGLHVYSLLVTPCTSEWAQSFGGRYCLHLQGRRISQARNQRGAGSKHSSA
jgi:hypothetical protein